MPSHILQGIHANAQGKITLPIKFATPFLAVPVKITDYITSGHNYIASGIVGTGLTTTTVEYSIDGMGAYVLCLGI